MKKVLITLIMLTCVITGLMAAGTPVFDWSAFLQFAEEAVQEAERWKTTYDKITKDLEQANKTFAEFDPSNLGNITSTISSISSLTQDAYSRITGETSQALRTATGASRKVNQGLRDPYYGDDPGYWIDVLQEYTTSDEDDVAEKFDETVANSQQSTDATTEYLSSSTGFFGSQSNADRDAANTAAIAALNAKLDQQRAEELKEQGDELARTLSVQAYNTSLMQLYKSSMKQEYDGPLNVLFMN